MKRTILLQELRVMRYSEAFEAWDSGRLSQEEAASLLGVCSRTFRRYMQRYESDGEAGLQDKRLTQISSKRATAQEVLGLTQLYKSQYFGWNVQHFHQKYRAHHQGTRSYTWVKNTLQQADVVKREKQRGKHRMKRERRSMAGMMVHQDGSRHQWIIGQPQQWWDLIVTMDDATSEIYSAFFVPEEGTFSSFRGVREVLEQKGLFCEFYSDRGSHYWTTPEVGGKVDKAHPTQFGRAMQQLGITMIAAYSPQARGRSERMFRTLQDRLPKELALAGIMQMDAANGYLRGVFLPAFNQEFSVEAHAAGDAFVGCEARQWQDVLCLETPRVVGLDNCVRYEKRCLQLPASLDRCHYHQARVMVREYEDGYLSVWHGPRCLARYDAMGAQVKEC